MANSIEAWGVTYTISGNVLEVVQADDPTDKSSGAAKGLAKFGRDSLSYFKSGTSSLPMPQGGGSAQIRLDSITNVTFGFTPGTGDSSTIGTIRISSAGSGPHGQFTIDVMAGKRDEATAFVEALRTAIEDASNRNRVSQGDASIPSGPVKVCPDCAEDIKLAARKCRHCGYTYSEEELEASKRGAELAEAAQKERERVADNAFAAPLTASTSTAGPPPLDPLAETPGVVPEMATSKARKKRNPIVVAAIVVGSLVILGTLIPVLAFAGPLFLAGIIGSSIPDSDLYPDATPSATTNSSAAPSPSSAPALGAIDPSAMSAPEITAALMSQGICNKVPPDLSGYDDSFQTCYFYNDPAEPTSCRWSVFVYTGTDMLEGIRNSQPPEELAYGDSTWAFRFDGFSDGPTRDAAESAFSSFLGRAPIALNPVDNIGDCGWTPSGGDGDY
jgi:hypothetical protein